MMGHFTAEVCPRDDEDPLIKEGKILPMPLTSEPEPIQQQFNIVLFGEMGAGKSSLVNLILGRDEAQTSSDALSCTLDVRSYDVTIEGRNFRMFDTVGLNEPQSFKDPEYLVGAINKAYGLVKYLSDTGGINLLLFCIRKGRITTNMQHNYHLFNDFLCHEKVPTALAITHLEDEEIMEGWWLENQSFFTQCGIRVVGHACTTTRREFGDRYNSSRRAIRDLLIAHGCGEGFMREKVGWVADLFRKLLEMMGIQPRWESVKIKAQKLRGYGLREEEIAALLRKMSETDEDMRDVQPLRHFFTLPWNRY